MAPVNTERENPYHGLGSLCLVFLHGIGDFVMLTPSLKKIKSLNPGLKMTVVVRKELGLKRLAEGTGLIDEVLELPLEKHPRFYVPWIFWTSEYWKIRKRLAALISGRHFDRVINIYYQLLPTFVYLALKPSRVKRHKIDGLAAELGLQLSHGDKNETIVLLPGALRQGAMETLRLAGAGGRKIIGIQRNTMDRTRHIPLGSVQGFIDGINGRVGTENVFFIVFANRDSYALEGRVDRGHLAAPNLKYSLDLSDGGDSLDLAAMIDACDYVLSVDSAVFNLASALGKKTIGVFNTYKVRSWERALEKDSILCLDSPDAKAGDLLALYRKLAGEETE